ncbi:MAG: hypothetical protein A2W80_01310 [Candidatus Riflebacteria bacterium GWC2_50_8]|nr:MAG: hypothetical protein A2W80_01310 [Candidatus Riflebacteria bacterium GWC2_50_8]
MIRNGCKILITLVTMLCCTPASKACSLALHDWRLYLHLKIPVSAPLLPLAELDAVFDKIPRNSIEKVIWVADHNQLSSFSLLFMHFLPNWEAHLPWHATARNASIIELARENRAVTKAPLIIGTDQNQLQIALFVDRNSDNRCFQLVFMQTSRIRAVHPDSIKPWAQESRGQSWLSLTFYQLPLPGRILAMAIFPIYQSRIALIDNHSFVEHLLADGLLATRPEQVFDPYSFDFPDLPE